MSHVAHLYRKKISRKSSHECKIDCDETSNFNQLIFIYFDYVTQIKRICLASLTYTGRKSLENQVANARLIVTKPQAQSTHFFIYFDYVTQIKDILASLTYTGRKSRKSSRECKIDCDETSNFNQLIFLYISITSLKSKEYVSHRSQHTGRKSLENQVANARLIVTKPQTNSRSALEYRYFETTTTTTKTKTIMTTRKTTTTTTTTRKRRRKKSIVMMMVYERDVRRKY